MIYDGIINYDFKESLIDSNQFYDVLSRTTAGQVIPKEYLAVFLLQQVKVLAISTGGGLRFIQTTSRGMVMVT